jgi:hypothetical protein
MQHSHDNNSTSLDPVIDNMALKKTPPIADTDVVTGGRRIRQIGQALQDRQQRFDVIIGLVCGPV